MGHGRRDYLQEKGEGRILAGTMVKVGRKTPPPFFFFFFGFRANSLCKFSMILRIYIYIYVYRVHLHEGVQGEAREGIQ